MSVITLAVYCFFSVMALAVFRKIVHPVVVFNLIWTVLIAVSRLGMFGLSIPMSNIYVMFLKGGITFNLVSLILNFTGDFLFKRSYSNVVEPASKARTKQRITLNSAMTKSLFLFADINKPSIFYV